GREHEELADLPHSRPRVAGAGRDALRRAADRHRLRHQAVPADDGAAGGRTRRRRPRRQPARPGQRRPRRHGLPDPHRRRRVRLCALHGRPGTPGGAGAGGARVPPRAAPRRRGGLQRAVHLAPARGAAGLLPLQQVRAEAPVREGRVRAAGDAGVVR
ncbi:MAG: hypothetical protein AVDCRST_MAG64-1901, partial [uncultured Phycisphaerae bacterium]